MAKASFQLDPNAQAYTDDEIVGKVNTATTTITRASCVDPAARPIGAGEVGATELADEAYTATEKTKLTGIEDSATADQSGAEIRDAIKGLGDTEREIVLTAPASGEYPVIAVHRQADGKLDVEYDDQPKP